MNLVSVFFRSFSLFVLLYLTSCKSIPTLSDKETISSDYNNLWSKVDSLANERLPKSALTTVNEIKIQAEAEGEELQMIKAILYENKFLMELGDKELPYAIKNLEAIVNNFRSPSREILHSYLGELYATYLNQNLWRLQSRGQLASGEEEIEVMSREDLVAKSDAHFLASIDFPEDTVMAIDSFALLLLPSPLPPNHQFLTINELLISRCLDHFEQAVLTSMGNTIFLENNPDYFAPLSVYKDIDLDFSDSTDHEYLTLGIYQEVLSNSSYDSVLFDLRRLNYVYRKSRLPTKDTLYINALKSLINSDIENDYKAIVSYQLASLYFQLQRLADAHALCQNVVSQYGESSSSTHCKRLLHQIEQPQLGLQIERVNLPGQAILAKVNYRNLDKIYYRIVEFSPADREELQALVIEDQIKKLMQSTTVAGSTIELKLTTDFLDHSTEISLPKLSIGSYLMIVSSSEYFEANESIIVGSDFRVSGLAYASMNFEGKAKILCFDRENGVALQGVKVEWYQQNYDRQIRQQVRRKVAETFSDFDGLAEMPSARGSYLPVLSKDKDFLDLQDYYLNSYSWDRISEDQIEVSYFLDRSIYRPGQIVFFKGILQNRSNSGELTVKPDTRFKVKLFNANGQEVNSLDVTSNAYGSFDGSFLLPDDGLYGQMSLGIDLANQRQFFRVEAYKRPTFEIQIDTIKSGVELGETVRVSGVITSYAGVPMANIDGFYRLVRTTRYPYFSRFSGFYWPPTPEREIKSGNFLTKSDGSFAFEFEALVDDLSEIQHSPVFDFSLQVRATDITGESQSEDRIISIGSDPFGIRYQGDKVVNLSENPILTFESVNAMGVPIVTNGEVLIRHVGDGSWKRNRYWDEPDLPVLDDAVFEDSLYWYHSYNPVIASNRNDEGRRISLRWERDKLLADLNGLDLRPGNYELEVKLSDNQGNKGENSFKIDLIDPNQSFVPSEELFYAIPSKRKVEAGDTLLVEIGSSQSGNFFYQIERKSGITEGAWLSFNGWQKLSIPVFDEDRGGLFIHIQSAFQNRILQKTLEIEVPWTNKQIQINSQSLRNVTQPGTKESITLILSKNGDPIQSEVLASMFDASLDALYPHKWNIDFYPLTSSQFLFSVAGYTIAYAQVYSSGPRWQFEAVESITIPTLNWFGFPLYSHFARAEAMNTKVIRSQAPPPPVMEEGDAAIKEKSEADLIGPEAIEAREDFSENLFFYPSLKTDDKGQLQIDFEMNDALTTWRLMLFAHDKEMASGYQEYSIVSRKELMITSNAPRFLRTGDKILFTAKIDNLLVDDSQVNIRLDLQNALTGASLNDQLQNSDELLRDVVIAGHSALSVSWQIEIPDTFHFPIQYTIYAIGENHQDAERGIIPVIENREFITATRAIEVPQDSALQVDISSLISLGSEKASNKKLTIDVTANPTWYALQSLPYLMEFPYECSEQIYNRLYANALGARILRDNPQLATIFNQWNDEDKSSPLEKNEDLKSAMLVETPWVREAMSQTDQIRRIAIFFQKNTLNQEQRNTVVKLKSRQAEDGGFPWFPGGRSNWYISEYIAEGLIDLRDWADLEIKKTIDEILEDLIPYLDDQFIAYYKNIEREVKKGSTTWGSNHLTPQVIYYLSFRDTTLWSLPEQGVNPFDYFIDQGTQYWTKVSLLSQVHLWKVFRSLGMSDEGDKMINSFRERKIDSPSLGSYWKDNNSWYSWWEMPLGIQAKMIQIFNSQGDQKTVYTAKRWLLNHKRTNNWGSTIATAEAIKALLVGNEQWISTPEPISVLIDGIAQEPTVIGNGLINQKFTIAPFDPEKGTTVSLGNPNRHPAWGAIYYQFFEELDLLQSDGGSLDIDRKLYLEEYGDKGPFLTEIEGRDLNPGDIIVIRMVVKSDRDLEFVHIEDWRSGSMEPAEVLSNYEWKNGLGYYRSNTDLATNFFIDRLSKGIYTLDYRVRISQRGDFSGGYTSVQSMYAPEFAAHSNGVRFKVQVLK